MDDFLEKLGLFDHRARSVEEKISTKILIEHLIDDRFSAKEMSNILCVSERTVLRRMVEYGLKIRNFSSISDDQVDYIF